MSMFMRLIPGVVALAPLLAQADAVAPLPADGSLAYVQQTDHGCVAGLWDSKAPDARKTAATAECPQQVSLTSQGRVLVMVGDAYVQTYDLASGKLGAPMPLPAEVPVQKTLDKEGLLAGYTPEGTLALQARWGHPYPNGYVDKYLYLRKGGAWVTAEHLRCTSYDDPCPFKHAFEAKPLTGIWGQAPGQIWNDALAGDPYVVKRVPEKFTVQPLPEEYDGSDDKPQQSYVRYNNSIVFRVYGRYSKLEFGAQPGEDSDAFHTFGVRLVAPDNRVLDITEDQFDAVIVGHYLLFYGFFDDGTKLYDAGNGQIVLDDLLDAAWLD